MNNSIKYQALPAILDREFARVTAKPIIEKYSPYLRELVNFSTHLFARAQASLPTDAGTHIPPISLFYHSIQITDAIEALIEESCFEATIPLLRSSWESTLAMEYIFEKDYDIRSASWLVAHYLERRRFCESLDRSIEGGSSLIKRLKMDRFMYNSKIPEYSDEEIRQEIARIDEVLAKEKFAKVVPYFIEKRNRKWYQINGGPRNLKELAEHLKRHSQYDLQYIAYSTFVHAHDALRSMSRVGDKLHITPIRSAGSNAEEISMSAGTQLLQCIYMISHRYRTDENVKDQIREIVARHRPEVLR